MKKESFVRQLSTFLVVGLATFSLSSPVLADEISDKLVILSTNDVHCDVENNLGYAGLAAYRDQMEDRYGEDYVILVDAGDAVQGGALGTLTNGEAIIDLMNAVGYDYFVPGNHEFDYGMEQHSLLMDRLDSHILSANFMDQSTGESVYDGFDVVDFGEVQVGFVGMTTPESFSADFRDDQGTVLYHLGGSDNLIYDYVQSAIDGAVAEGADLVVAIGHLGTESKSQPWRSTDIIANTYGLDLFIDGHSHEVIKAELHQDLQGNEVILTQTGSHLDHIGEIVIDLATLEITVDFVPEDFALRSETVGTLLADIQEEFEALLQIEVAEIDVDFLFTDPETGHDAARLQETNLANLVSDAYRVVMETEIGLINGGGIRQTLERGTITYGDIINIHPFGNEVSSMWVSGQDLLDALEVGARYQPESTGAFLQVSGMCYSVNLDIESSVVTGENEGFVRVDGEYRVHSVTVGDEPLDLEKMYSVGAIDYLLLDGGSSMSMFPGNEVIKESLYIDSDLLIFYIRDVLGGVVGEGYENPNGSGRITIGSLSETEEEPTPEEPETPVTPETPEEPEEPETPAQPEEPAQPEDSQEAEEPLSYTVKTGDNLSYIARSVLGSANRWNEIYAINKDVIKNPNYIYAGQVLQLPAA